MNLEQAKQTFVEEGRDLLQEMEDALLRIESSGGGEDDINAIFRAAHTIKGSAGLFGFSHVVSFTHVVENLLDKVRNGGATLSGGLITVLLSCCDHMRRLIEHVAANDGADPPEDMRAEGESLVAGLRQYGDGTAPAPAVAPPKEEGEAAVSSPRNPGVEADTWHISLRFGKEVLRNGMDPLSFIRYLGTLGSVVAVTTLADAMPPAAEMDPEECYLGFEIDFMGDVTKETLEGVFEFVQDDCWVRILPPHSQIDAYFMLIQDLPEDKQRLGDILVSSGALTHKELESALALQREQALARSTEGEQVEPPLPIGEILVRQGAVQQPVVEAALEKQKQARDTKAQESKFIRVHAEKLDQLINLVGELVIAGAGANLLAQRAGQPLLQEATSSISRLVDEIRDGALQLRMVEIGDTFHRFQRVVRDVSQELGKDIDLVINGAETELDKTVVEKIGDPLLHLVRNAIDHGIEPSAVRGESGKKPKGTLWLNAYHDSGSIVIEVADDGRGLNRDKVLQKALDMGLVNASQTLSDQDVFNLVFEPGFSTAEKVTNLSGRGVGMDVVRRNIESLRGTVEIDSELGSGTTVRIRLPLTLAIIDGFLVGVGKSAYVVPLDMVLECVEVSDEDRQATRERNYVNLRGEVLPYLHLRDQFEIEGAPPRRENIVVVQYAGEKAGLVVDELLGEFQTVIKPLSSLFRHLKGISGSTILGSGEVALILDVPSLVQRAVNSETQSAVAQKQALAVH